MDSATYWKKNVRPLLEKLEAIREEERAFASDDLLCGAITLSVREIRDRMHRAAQGVEEKCKKAEREYQRLVSSE